MHGIKFYIKKSLSPLSFQMKKRIFRKIVNSEQKHFFNKVNVYWESCWRLAPSPLILFIQTKPFILRTVESNPWYHDWLHYPEVQGVDARRQMQKEILLVGAVHACSRVVVSGGKMATLGDASAPGVNGLIQQFTAITGKYWHFAFAGIFAQAISLE